MLSVLSRLVRCFLLLWGKLQGLQCSKSDRLGVSALHTFVYCGVAHSLSIASDCHVYVDLARHSLDARHAQRHVIIGVRRSDLEWRCCALELHTASTAREAEALKNLRGFTLVRENSTPFRPVRYRQQMDSENI